MSEVSGSPLADRLVRAAQEAIFNEPTRPDEIGQQYTYDGRAATAAVLRAVADELFEELLSRVEPGMVVRPNVIPELLRKWAVSVEEGER